MLIAFPRDQSAPFSAPSALVHDLLGDEGPHEGDPRIVRQALYARVVNDRGGYSPYAVSLHRPGTRSPESREILMPVRDGVATALPGRLIGRPFVQDQLEPRHTLLRGRA